MQAFTASAKIVLENIMKNKIVIEDVYTYIIIYIYLLNA